MKTNYWKVFTNGLFKENPVLILVLGCCSVLAISTTVSGALGMGAAMTFVLLGSNVVISLLRKVIPDKVRIPCYIVVIAVFVTVVQMVVQAYVPTLYDSLGVFLPLIVVNCIVLGRAEMFANKNGPGAAFFDGLGMGLGYMMVLVGLAVVREFFGSGSIFDVEIPFMQGHTIGIISQTPGGFFMFGCVMALLVWALDKHGKKFKPTMGCGEDGCSGCGMADGCTSKDKEA